MYPLHYSFQYTMHLPPSKVCSIYTQRTPSQSHPHQHSQSQAKQDKATVSGLFLHSHARTYEAAQQAQLPAKEGMGNSLRCCLACMLPCGALDVVRVVHLSGHVDEFTCPLVASDVLAAHPNHALTAAGSAGAARRIVIVSPDSELRRGRIYFLIPTACSAPAVELKRRKHGACPKSRKRQGHRKSGGVAVAAASTAEQDDYLMELLSDQKQEPSHRRRRSSSARTAVWRPRLESIAEEPSD